MLYAVPNGGNRNIVTARKLKAEGVKPGVPDVCLPVPRGDYHGLYVEMKRQKGGVVSPEQKAWLQALKGQGYRAEVCKGAAEAWDVIREYIQAQPNFAQNCPRERFQRGEDENGHRRYCGAGGWRFGAKNQRRANPNMP